MSRPILIIHFQPVELYPPVMNLMVFISEFLKGKKVIVLTTRANSGKIPGFVPGSADITIKRLGRSGKGLGSISRIFNYLLFYLGAIVIMAIKRPRCILYFETLSSYPAYLYKRFFKKDASVLIHYHEYTSPSEYANGMKLARFFHQKEKWLYPQAAWISHTNEERMSMFMHDEHLAATDALHILPNYPSRKWYTPRNDQPAFPVRVVYVGALSLETMYTGNFCAWVQSMNGKILWDIYSVNITDTARQYIDGLNSKWIRILGGVNYYDLPRVLSSYHVGVILYNGHIPNYIYNAPNKLFEYLACGLNVWFPSVMKGVLKYAGPDTRPRVTEVDFTNLSHFEPGVQETKNCNAPGVYYYEEVLTAIVEKLLKSA